MIAGNSSLLDASKEPWPGGTRHQLSTVGIELDRIEEEIIARPPSADEADELGIDTGVSMLAIRKVSIDVTGRVVEVADLLLPGDRTELHYTVKLDRWPA